MLDIIQKYLKRYNFTLDESVLSLMLGIAVVAATAFLSYHYLNLKKPNSKTVLLPSVTNSVPVPGVIEPNNDMGQLTPAASTSAVTGVHVIQSGDTFWSISEKYFGTGFDWHQIAFANPQVYPNNLVVGDKLIIPNSNLATSAGSFTGDKITGSSYTVVHGDNLWKIAFRAYGDPYRWVEIARFNNLVNPSLIHTGNILKLAR